MQSPPSPPPVILSKAKDLCNRLRHTLCHPERSERPMQSPPSPPCHPERSERPMQSPPSPPCHPERSEGPMQPLYACASVILSEAKDPCNQIYPPVPPSARASSRPLVNHPILHNEIHLLQHRH